MKFKKSNIYKPGTKDYYKDALWVLQGIIMFDTSACKTKKECKELIGDIEKYIKIALKGGKLYCEFVGNKKTQ